MMNAFREAALLQAASSSLRDVTPASAGDARTLEEVASLLDMLAAGKLVSTPGRPDLMTLPERCVRTRTSAVPA